MQFRKTTIPGGFILADANLQPEDGWFDARFWRRSGEGESLGRGRGTAFSAGDEGQWVLRHYRRGGWPARLISDRYAWLGVDRTRPVHEFRILAKLADAGAPVPRPVAARVVRRAGLYRGDILVERVRDAKTLAGAAPSLSAVRWAEVGRAIRRFHDVGGWHADLNAKNILLGPGGVTIIDLDRGRCHCASARRQRANLDRLYRSLVKLGLLPAAQPGWEALLSGYERLE